MDSLRSDLITPDFFLFRYYFESPRKSRCNTFYTCIGGGGGCNERLQIKEFSTRLKNEGV